MGAATYYLTAAKNRWGGCILHYSYLKSRFAMLQIDAMYF